VTVKLWLLRPILLGKGAWKDYDVHCGFIVRADSEERARQVADGTVPKYEPTRGKWLDASETSCVEVTGDGDEEVILSDYAAG